ncbi:MAG: hypothetical protein ACRENE_21810 [Polyangiaceae bacterium]
MHTETIDYAYDGEALRGYLAVAQPRTGRVPGVLVVHHAGGLGDEIKEKTRRLASSGTARSRSTCSATGSP